MHRDHADAGFCFACVSFLSYVISGLLQNANIFPKNIHFFAVLFERIAKELGVEVGEYTHWITNLCHDRHAICC